ncbi:hypothetical protein [Arthrobacter sp. MAHUQ-56]
MAQSQPYARAGAVSTAASACWLLGIAMVGNVHATRSAEQRLAMLERHRGLWTLGQFLAAAGTAAAPMGFLQLARRLRQESRNAETEPALAGNLSAVAAAALLAGSPFFVWDLAVRAADIEKFAYRRGAAWPFLTYSGLETCGIGLLGAGLQSSPLKGRTALSAAASAPLFAGILLRYKDIPPFVFYLVEAALGVKLLRFTAASGDG